METAQITQSLRAAMLQQSQQGMTVSQMMESGMSFADIIIMMMQGQQDGMSLMQDNLIQTADNVDSENNLLFGLLNGENQNSIFSQQLAELMNISLKNETDFELPFDIDYESLGEDSNEQNIKFADNLIKADPFQLAGLLDYISTGYGIPVGSDISDNKIFDDFQQNNYQTENVLFDPEEMIKSGEMEIVNYVPASTEKSDSGISQNDGEVLDFYRTMNSVKENVKSDETKPDDKTVNYNIEDMNRYTERIDISFERASAETTMNKMEYEAPDKQLLDGISENLDKGLGQFTVKLKPEGLGEILVNLVQNDDGKMLLTMVASNEKTAELLNKDLASLQSSLSQHNVEISPNGVDIEHEVASLSSAFDQYDERRQDEANQENQYRQLREKLGDISIRNVGFDTELQNEDVHLLDQALNITI